MVGLAGLQNDFDYNFVALGPLAQLVERSHGMGEVRSSNLLGSTIEMKPQTLLFARSIGDNL